MVNEGGFWPHDLGRQPAACILHSPPCDCVPAAAGGPGRPGWQIPAPPAQVYSTLTGSCSSPWGVLPGLIWLPVLPPATRLGPFTPGEPQEAGGMGTVLLRPVTWPLCALATLAFPHRICCVPGWLASPGSCPSVTSAIMTLFFLHSDIFGSNALALLCRAPFVTIKSVQTLRWG